MSTSGKIVQIIGAVIDIAFAEENVPNILDAIEVEFTVNDETKKLVLEVQQHLGEGVVRAVAMSSTDGLKRGMAVNNTGLKRFCPACLIHSTADLSSSLTSSSSSNSCLLRLFNKSM